jgi:outer membrane protein TolC
VAERSAVEAVQGSLDALEAQLAVARTMEEVGRIAPLDRLKVEVRAASVRQQLSRTRRDRDLILTHLSALLGRGLASYQEAGEREAVARSALDQARQAFAVERQSYELGRSTVNDVLDAQAALLEAELAHAQASHDRALAAVIMARAAGRDVVALLGGGNGADE